MRRIACSLAVATVAALLAPGAFAQMNAGAARTLAEPFETVVSVSPDVSRIVVQDAAGQQRTVLLNDATGIVRQGRSGTSATPIRIGEIAAGDRIVVSGSSRQGGFTAQRIQVFQAGDVGAPPPGVVTPPGGANPASPPGSVRPGDPNAGAGANPASPPNGGAGANPASPPNSGAGSNPASPPGAAGGSAP